MFSLPHASAPGARLDLVGFEIAAGTHLEGEAGARARLQLGSRDEFGNLKEQGGDTLELGLVDAASNRAVGGEEDGTKLWYQVLDERNGTCIVEYEFVRAGVYLLHASINSELVRGSPFGVTIAPSLPSSKQCVLALEGTSPSERESGAPWVLVGHPVTPLVELRDWFGNAAVVREAQDVSLTVKGTAAVKQAVEFRSERGATVTAVCHSGAWWRASTRPSSGCLKSLWRATP